MYKKIVCVFIYLSMILPVIASAAALQKYSVPPQKLIPHAQPDKKARHVDEDVYVKFRLKIKDYSEDKKDKMVDHYRVKAKASRKEKNKDAEVHYLRLISIINE